MSFEQMEMKNYVRIQELACKTINLILTRYSKKFHKIAAIICNLFINILLKKLNFKLLLFLFKFVSYFSLTWHFFLQLISHTTLISNQSNLQDSNMVNLALKAAQDLERVITQLLTFKKEFSKISPYMISEYVNKANLIAIHPKIKVIILLPYFIAIFIIKNLTFFLEYFNKCNV